MIIFASFAAKDGDKTAHSLVAKRLITIGSPTIAGLECAKNHSCPGFD